jgi:hypothetical protein
MLMFLRGLTFDMSGPEPAWPAQRNMNLRSEAGQAGGGPLDGRVRQHCGARYFAARSGHLPPSVHRRLAKMQCLTQSASLHQCFEAAENGLLLEFSKVNNR